MSSSWQINLVEGETRTDYGRTDCSAIQVSGMRREDRPVRRERLSRWGTGGSTGTSLVLELKTIVLVLIRARRQPGVYPIPRAKRAREERNQPAKIRLAGLGRSQDTSARSIIWKTPVLAGQSLWKGLRIFFHNVDSRGLDSPKQEINTRSTQTPGVPPSLPPSFPNDSGANPGRTRNKRARRCAQSFPQMWTVLWTNPALGGVATT